MKKDKTEQEGIDQSAEKQIVFNVQVYFWPFGERFFVYHFGKEQSQVEEEEPYPIYRKPYTTGIITIDTAQSEEFQVLTTTGIKNWE